MKTLIWLFFFGTVTNSSDFERPPFMQSPLLPASPTTVSVAASSVGGTTATLNGTSVPNYSNTTGWFRYSSTNPGACDDSFGTRTPSSSGTNLGYGSVATAFSASLTGLTGLTNYYFCAISQNEVSKTYGSIRSFTTTDAAVYRLLATLPATLCDGSAITGSNGESVTVTRSTARYCEKADGTLVLVASGQPRVGRYGLMVEPLTTNNLIRSSAFNTGWSLDATGLAIPVVTANVAQSPVSGTDVTAEQIDFPDTVLGVGHSDIRQTVTTTAQPYTASFYIKGKTGSGNIYIYVYDGSFHSKSCSFTNSAWARCVYTTPTLAAGSTIVALGFNFADVTQTGVNGAFSIYAWGAQFESHAYVTSLTDTTGSTNSYQPDRISANITYPGGYTCAAGKITWDMTPFGGLVAFLGAGQGYWIDTRASSVDGVAFNRDTQIKAITANHTTANQMGGLNDPVGSSIFSPLTKAVMWFSWKTGERILKKDGSSIISDSDSTAGNPHLPTLCQSSYEIGSLQSSSSSFTEAGFQNIAFFQTPTD